MGLQIPVYFPKHGQTGEAWDVSIGRLLVRWSAKRRDWMVYHGDHANDLGDAVLTGHLFTESLPPRPLALSDAENAALDDLDNALDCTLWIPTPDDVAEIELVTNCLLPDAEAVVYSVNRATESVAVNRLLCATNIACHHTITRRGFTKASTIRAGVPLSYANCADIFIRAHGQMWRVNIETGRGILPKMTKILGVVDSSANVV
jgi:hypothetical protein